MQRRAAAAAGLVVGGAAGLGGMQMMKMQREYGMNLYNLELKWRNNNIENMMEKIGMLREIIRNNTKWYDFEEREKYKYYLDWFEVFRPNLRRELDLVDNLMLDCVQHEQ
eukprot:2271989-Rhodomonas_salina.1